MQFAVAIERGSDAQAFGVVVPDLPGCYSAGDTFEDALVNAREAIVMHLEMLGSEGVEVVVPQGIDAYVDKPEFKGWLWGFVDVDDRLLSDKVERINITVPARKLQIIDKAAGIAKQPRSEYLVENAVARAMELLGKAPALKPAATARKRRKA
jgi:predicted RNase H-like HicB family nuclease